MAPLRWSKGGEAELVSLAADIIHLRSTIPSAPGSRLDATMPSGAGFRVKVHRCQKIELGFAIEGRLIDLRREVRGELEALLPKTESEGRVAAALPGSASEEESRTRRARARRRRRSVDHEDDHDHETPFVIVLVIVIDKASSSS